jgi:hypothetical protein
MPSTQNSSVAPAVMYSGLTVKPFKDIPGQFLSLSGRLGSVLNGRRRQALWYSQTK